MAATPNYLVGKVVSVTAAGASMYARKGDVTRKAESVKTTNARSNGYQEVKPGIKSANGSCEVVYNGDDPPALTEGTEVAVVYAAAGGETKTIQALITQIKDTFATDGEYNYSFDFESSGEYTVA